MASKALMSKRQTVLDKLLGLLKDGDIDGLRVVERMARRYSASLTKAENQKTGVKAGARVSFVPKDGVKRTGTVVRLGPKRATVLTEAGRWAVPFTMLEVVS